MQALSVTEGSGCGGGLHAADTRAKMFVSLLASVATVALSGVEPQMVLFGMSLVYALGMRQFRILLIGYAVLVGMSLLAMGCAFGMSLLIPSMPAFSAVSLVVPFLRMATMLNVILPLAFSCRVQSLLTAVHDNLYAQAEKNLEDNTFDLNSWQEVKEMVETKGGFARTKWCGKLECELKMKELAGVSSRCMPLKQSGTEGVCPVCGEKCTTDIYWGVAY